ncbi:MAG: EamA family transporter [Pirellulales bacterium]
MAFCTAHRFAAKITIFWFRISHSLSFRDSSMIFFVCLLVASLFVAANLAVMQSVNSTSPKLWMLATSVLAIAAFFAHRSVVVKFGALRATGIVDSLLTILTMLAAWLWFREQLTLQQWVGISLLLVGLYLVK